MIIETNDGYHHTPKRKKNKEYTQQLDFEQQKTVEKLANFELANWAA